VERKNYYDNDNKVIVAIAGGDGTFMNIVKDTKAHGIIFTQLPFGTSNDLARTFNWGPRPSRKMRNNLKILCNELNNATEVKFDIWEINIITNEFKGISLIILY